MNAPTVEVGDAPDADEFDVIAACQRWLELDYPDQATTDPCGDALAVKGDPR